MTFGVGRKGAVELSVDFGGEFGAGVLPAVGFDHLAVALAPAGAAVGPELGHVGALNDVPERAGPNAQLDQAAEREIDGVDESVGLLGDRGRLAQLLGFLLDPGGAAERLVA